MKKALIQRFLAGSTASDRARKAGCSAKIAAAEAVGGRLLPDEPPAASRGVAPRAAMAERARATYSMVAAWSSFPRQEDRPGVAACRGAGSRCDAE